MKSCIFQNAIVTNNSSFYLIPLYFGLPNPSVFQDFTSRRLEYELFLNISNWPSS